MTNKNFIIRYILLKIILGEYKVDTLIPSENKLALRFKCTRINIRQVYLKLIEHNILYSIHGKGYYVSNNAINQIYYPYNIIKDCKLEFTNNVSYKNNIYNFTYYIYDDKNLIGYIDIESHINFNHNDQINNINKLLNEYIININLDCDEIINSYQNNQYINNNIYSLFNTQFINKKNKNNNLIINTYILSNININLNKKILVN